MWYEYRICLESNAIKFVKKLLKISVQTSKLFGGLHSSIHVFCQQLFHARILTTDTSLSQSSNKFFTLILSPGVRPNLPGNQEQLLFQSETPSIKDLINMSSSTIQKKDNS